MGLCLQSVTLLCFIPIFNFVWIFICGAKGNTWAWKANGYKEEDLDKFLAIQNTWNRAGMISFIMFIGLFIVYILILIALVNNVSTYPGIYY